MLAVKYGLVPNGYKIALMDLCILQLSQDRQMKSKKNGSRNGLGIERDKCCLLPLVDRF